MAARAFAKWHTSMFELMRGDLSRAASNAVARVTREHDLPLWSACRAFLEGWASARGATDAGGLEAMRRGVELLRQQNVLPSEGFLKIALAEAQARAGDLDRAVAVLDEALATSERTGYRPVDTEQDARDFGAPAADQPPKPTTSPARTVKESQRRRRHANTLRCVLLPPRARPALGGEAYFGLAGEWRLSLELR